jgi:signal transduction histidine kinase
VQIDPQIASSQPTSEPPLLSRRWWLPLVFVVLSLLVLAVVPVAVEQRVRSVRYGAVAASDRARVLINDLEAAFATEMLQPDSAEAPAGASLRESMEQVTADADSLALAVQAVDSETSRRFEQLRAQLGTWRGPGSNGVTSPSALREARAILRTADSLDLHLMRVSEEQRTSVRQLERFDVASALVLVPLALIAIGVVVWGGQRVVHFARVAERERAEVVRSTEARAALLRGVTHDVKNPLGAASGYAHLLADGVAGALTESQVEMLRRIQRLVDTSVRTVTDLLELARADGAPIHLDRVEVDLATIAKEVVEDHHGLVRERGLRLSLAVSPIKVNTDPLRVRQVLTNLLSNAIKYTPSGGTITVQTVHDRRSDPRVGIAVRDTGPGVPPELRERIFDEFVRADSATATGSGVGLAISRRLARMLGGEVTYVPNQPSGAVFTLWLDASGLQAPRPTPMVAAREHS